MLKSLLVTVVLFVAAQIALSQSWVPTSSGTNQWLCVASSANGGTLIAGQWPGCIGVSTNAGATWTTNVMTNGYWGSVASSADGTKLLAASPNIDSGHICGVFLSTNSGASWISNSLPEYYWGSVAMSADGNTMAAVAPIVSGSDSFSYVGSVFCSTNGGVNWVSNNINFTQSWAPAALGVAMSADGSKIFAVAPPEVCCSTNFGMSWMQLTNAPQTSSWVSPSQVIASSADGNKLVMCDSYNGNPILIYTSTNSGETWNLAPVAGGNWSFVAASADGKTLIAAGMGLEAESALIISTNSGASWTSNSVPNGNWVGVACSADGGAQVAAGSDGYTAINGGAIYVSQSVQPPLLNIAPSGSDLQLSWLIPSTNFVLEQSADLYNWSVVTNAPALNLANLDEQVLVSPTNGADFYRLVH